MGTNVSLVQAADGITNASIADNAFGYEHFTVDSAMTTVLGRRVVRADAALPQTATTAIFTIAGGDILLTCIYAVVGTVIQAQACNLNIQANPTAAGTSLDLAAVLNISAKAAASYISMTGTLANAMTNGVAAVAQTFPIICPTGTIDAVTSASNTGTLSWVMFYVPLTPGATVTAA